MKTNDWRVDIEQALQDFTSAGGLTRDIFRTEYFAAPHKPPSRLPPGKMAVYGFWVKGWRWLKIGKAGPNSSARYAYQHYNGCAGSTFAGSLRRDPEMPVFGCDLPIIG